MAIYKAISAGNNCGIYKITSPSGKIYIGSSINIKRRFSDYKRLRCKSQSKLYSSFLKYGVDKHLFEVICICEKIDLYKNERALGLEFDVLSKDGLNLQLPSYGELPPITSDETRLKQSLIKKGKPSNSPTKFKKGMIPHNKGKTMSDTLKEKLRLINTGKVISENHKQKIAEASRNRIWSQVSRDKLSKSKKGCVISKETREKISNSNLGREGPNKKKIFMISLIDNNIIIFDSITNASQILNIKRTSISNNLNGYSKTVNSIQYGKIKFEYYNDKN